MRLLEGLTRIEQLANRPFSSIFSQAQLEDIILNKGKSGQILEIAIGLQNSPNPLDFEDGELKTNKVNEDGKPMETMAIKQIMSTIDNLLHIEDFYSTELYNKINNLLYVPICKMPRNNPENWQILQPIHVDLNSTRFRQISEQIEADYYSICEQLNLHITSNDRFIHTSSGQYIQIRSKDSRPYHPIYSHRYHREVSNKNYAFYFKKEFMIEIQRIEADD